MCIVELISTGDGQIVETLDNIGIKLFVLAALKEHWLYLSLFVCLGSVVQVSMQYRLCLETVKELQNGRLHRFSKRIVCRCTFSWSICNKNRHFIRCIRSSSFQDYDDIHKSWEDINS